MKNKTIFITGASRGIGRAIALRCARDGANIVIAAKTVEPHPKLAGHDPQRGGRSARPPAAARCRCQLDIRDEDAVLAAVKQAAETFGGIDVLVNNASAISLTGTLATPIKRYDLMQGINARGTFLCSQACLPHLLKAANPHILTLSPPLNLKPKWFKRARRLHDGQVRHEHVHAGHGGRVRRPGRGGELAVAAHDDRDRRGRGVLSRRCWRAAASRRSWPTPPM